MAAQPLERPTQRRRGGLMPGAQERQQLVGNVLARHRGAVVVPAAQQQRQNVGALFEARVGFGLVDQRENGAVEVAAELREPAPRAVAPRAERRFRQGGHPRPQLGPRRNDLAQEVEFRAVGPEHGAQDDIQRDPVHRFERPELVALRPSRGLAQRLLFDDLFVVLDALAMERRGEQLTASPMFLAVQREHRTRSEDPAEVGLHVHQVVGAREEDLPQQSRIGDDHTAAEERDVDGEDGAVTLHRVSQEPAAEARQQDTLDGLWQAHDGRHLARSRRGLRFGGHCGVSHG